MTASSYSLIVGLAPDVVGSSHVRVVVARVRRVAEMNEHAVELVSVVAQIGSCLVASGRRLRYEGLETEHLGVRDEMGELAGV